MSGYSEPHSEDRLLLLEDWMEQFGSDVLNVAYGYVKNYHVAEDITQDVFLRAYTKMDSFRGQSSVRTWLLSITANRCKDYLRSWAVRHEVHSELGLEREPGGTQTEQDVVARMERDALWNLVHRLPLKYREVLLLFYQRELSTAEVAQTLGITEATARTRLHRGRTLLRQWMEAGEVEP
ncbi:sigma-70 family RNA polymerase sigma factor [Alicyclobacillus cycloheptanicus]|uniref:RNA polymerase sigma factor n=1 Tax=Alicyclobacillus cycloheptanicus TaxID=1457 RepID=A0ABT9XLH6_9BACL|nr:sigma-70 family RNA polymerase sigma factor [Alicyclobacillus cycloheptanicus]MDQ0190608.1 RNA polymerase sigma-70 factor (ECF subfamily) [Alicyclobacillus cycloheptanicus]